MMIRNSISASVTAALVATGISLSALGGAYATVTHSEGHGSSVGKPGKAEDATRTIEVVMRDNLFDPERISVTEGETVRFTIKNQGELVHEFNIGTAAMHAEHQKEMMTMMEHGVLEPDRINHEKMTMDMGGGKTMNHSDTNSVLVEPGKSAEVVWTFTENANLEFACNVPGHYQSGMMGEIEFRHGS